MKKWSSFQFSALCCLLFVLPLAQSFSLAPPTSRSSLAHTKNSSLRKPPMNGQQQHRIPTTALYIEPKQDTLQNVLSSSSSSSSSIQQVDSSHANGFNSKSSFAKGLIVPLICGLVALPASPSMAMESATSLYQQFSETGFYQALSIVFLSEIGDKTFFIAGLLAMKSSKFISFVGSLGALAVMTVISVLIGQIFHAVPSGIAQGIPLDDVAAVLAFAFFGIKTLMEALDGEGGVMDEELEEAEEVVEELEKGGVISNTFAKQIASIFGLVFAAEFGDRSFLSTIALSAAQNPVGVAGGAILAHGLATGIAVSGGAYLSKYISEKVIGIISGTLFLVFAVTTAFGIF